MKIEGSVALVTGANRGLGQASPGSWSAGARPRSTGPRVIRTPKSELSRDQELIYPPLQEFWDSLLKGHG